VAYAIRNVHEPAKDLDCDEDLARWLEESGRRRAIPRKLAEGTDIEPSAKAANGAARVSARRLILVGVLALSAMQYLYADVHLSIYKLPSLVVFASPR
jgi:hypothetical protein